MLEHAVTAIRCDDGERHALRVVHAVFMRGHHGAWVKSGNLVVVGIGGNKGLRGEGAGHGFDVRAG